MAHIPLMTTTRTMAGFNRSPLPKTEIGTLLHVGRWTIALELGGAGRRDRACAYRIAADLCDDFAADGFDVRVTEGPRRIAVDVEVASDDDFARVAAAFVRAAAAAAKRAR